VTLILAQLSSLSHGEKIMIILKIRSIEKIIKVKSIPHPIHNQPRPVGKRIEKEVQNADL
jgi:hypothetical protein